MPAGGGNSETTYSGSSGYNACMRATSCGLRSSGPEANATLTLNKGMPVERGAAFGVLVPHRQRLQPEGGRDGINERQRLVALPSEPETTGQLRIGIGGLESRQAIGLERG